MSQPQQPATCHLPPRARAFICRGVMGATVPPRRRRPLRRVVACRACSLTDDQDQLLGGSFPHTAPHGATPLPQASRLLAGGGATATAFYIHTPICWCVGRHCHDCCCPRNCHALPLPLTGTVSKTHHVWRPERTLNAASAAAEQPFSSRNNGQPVRLPWCRGRVAD